MIPIMQTTSTNCYAACIASLIGCPIEEIPLAGGTWDWLGFQRWMAARGLQVVDIELTGQPRLQPLSEDVLCILSGKSPRNPEGMLHAVVGRVVADRWQVIHDPHRDGRGIIGEPTHVSFIVPLVPGEGG